MSRTALLRDRALVALLARETISAAGSQMTFVALPWFVLTTTGSATRMSIVVAVQAAAFGIVGFASGNVVTRVGPRMTMLVADACRAPLMLAIPVLHWSDLLSFPVLLVLVFVASAFGTPSFASKAALLPEIVGEDEATLTDANALLQVAQRLSLVLGPPLAGVLIGLLGATTVLVIDAATFAVAFLLIAGFVRVGRGHPETDESRGLSAGIRFLLRDPLLRPWSIGIIAGDVAWMAFFVSMPFLVVTRFGDEPEILGWILGGFGAGAVAGSVVVLRVARRVDRLLLSSFGEVATIAPLWLFVTGAPAWALVVALTLAGICNGLVNAPIWTIFTLRVPQRLRTKTWAAIVATTSLIGPFVLLATGPALENVGLTETLIAIVSVHTLAAALFFVGGLRERVRLGRPIVEPETA